MGAMTDMGRVKMILNPIVWKWNITFESKRFFPTSKLVGGRVDLKKTWSWDVMGSSWSSNHPQVDSRRFFDQAGGSSLGRSAQIWDVSDS